MEPPGVLEPVLNAKDTPLQLSPFQDPTQDRVCTCFVEDNGGGSEKVGMIEVGQFEAFLFAGRGSLAKVTRQWRMVNGGLFFSHSSSLSELPLQPSSSSDCSHSLCSLIFRSYELSPCSHLCNIPPTVLTRLTVLAPSPQSIFTQSKQKRVPLTIDQLDYD